MVDVNRQTNELAGAFRTPPDTALYHTEQDQATPHRNWSNYFR